MRGIARDLLNDPNAVVRAAAIGLLGRTGSAELLCAAENDSNGQVRTLARLACEKLASTNEKGHVR
jgi:HEAT repeat protein